MTTTLKNLIPRKFAEAAQTAQFTATGKLVIDKFTVTNVSALNAQFSANLVASGGTASPANLVLHARTMRPGDSYLCPELVGQTLEAGGFISTLASAASALVISASGREIT